MRIWQAHLALAQMIGDPIAISGSPVTVIPDGVRYSKKLRDLYLYRAMLNILDGVLQQAVPLPAVQAATTIHKYLPNYIVEDTAPTITGLNPEYTMPLTRRPALMLAVYNEGNVQFSPESLPRFYANLYSPYHAGRQDPTYVVYTPQALGATDSYAKGTLRFQFSTGFASKWYDSPIHAVYVPTPIDPSGQTPEDVLDFEPILYDKVITTANTFAKADAQEG